MRAVDLFTGYNIWNGDLYSHDEKSIPRPGRYAMSGDETDHWRLKNVATYNGMSGGPQFYINWRVRGERYSP
jgi:hypothetical protein